MRHHLIINLIIVTLCAIGYITTVVALFHQGQTSMGWNIPTVILLIPFFIMIGVAITLIVMCIIKRQ